MNREDRLVLKWFERHRPPEGDRLPPERELAEMLGLSRAALRKGLASLEARGLLLRQVGRGTFVQGRGGGSAAPDRPSASVMPVASPRQILMARLAFEPGLARQAAGEADRTGLDTIAAAETRVREAETRDAFVAADDGFHRSIAQACVNPLLLRLFDEMLEASRGIDWTSLGRPNSPPPHADDRTFEQHRGISDAILARDPQEAGRAMRRHLLEEAVILVEKMV